MEEGARSSHEEAGPLFPSQIARQRSNSIVARSENDKAPAGASSSSRHGGLISSRAVVVPASTAPPHQRDCAKQPASPMHPAPTHLEPADEIVQVHDFQAFPANSSRNLLSSLFKCLCRAKAASVRATHVNTSLLRQSHLHHQALIESEETRDMWEWQMEQQQLLTSQEHDLVEKQCPMGLWPLEQQLLPRNSNASQSSSGSTSLLCRTRKGEASSWGGGAFDHSDEDDDDYDVAETVGDVEKAEITHGSPRNNERSRRRRRRRQKTGSVEAKVRGSPSPVSPIVLEHLPKGFYSYDLQSASLLLFEATILRSRSEINVFCRVYMQQMVLSGFTIIKTLTELEHNTVFQRKVHCSHALESRVCSVLFRCFENDSFDDTGLMQIFDPEARTHARMQDYFRLKAIDPEEALAIQSSTYDPTFHQFCVQKSEEIASMFTWSMAYRNATERDRFMEAFLRVAKWVWMLHRLAHAAHPPMQIIRVGRGMELHPLYVEAVPPPPTINCPKCPVPKVEFMIMPGFITPKKVLKAKVYQHYMCRSGQ